MVVDTSVVVAILREETGFRDLVDEVLAVEACMAAPSFLETCMVVQRDLGAGVEVGVNEVLSRLGVEVVAFTPAMAKAAVDAFLRYGKGRHPARLNYGDCISYALAKTTGKPLLWVGDDFDLTDVKRA